MAFDLAAGLGSAFSGATGAGLLSAGGSLISGLLGSNASSQAAKAQEQGSMNNINFQTNLLKQSQTTLAPFLGTGYGANNTLASLLSPGANMQSTLEGLPGFKFQSKWGTKATQNALAAEGLGGSTGPLAKGISDYNSGLASTSYNNFVQQLLSTANMGLGAGESLSGAATTVGQSGGAALSSAGNAAASGILGSNASLSNGITGAAGSGANALLLQNLLGGSGGGIFGGGSTSNENSNIDNAAADFYS